MTKKNKSDNILWEKFKQDVRRYLADHSLSSPLKLLFVIDFWPIVLLRLEEVSFAMSIIPKIFMNFFLLFLRPLIQGMSGTRIFTGAEIGGGILLHTSVGIVIASEAKLGKNCTLLSGASVVHKANKLGGGAPVIGDNVIMMAGCKVIGNVTIGNNVIVGANAVVLHDVPDSSIAIGVPAEVRKITDEKA